MSDLDNERENAAQICECLALRWEASAVRLLEEGTRKSWFGKPYVLPRWKRDAETVEAAANGLRAVASVIRSGARSLNTTTSTPDSARAGK